MSKQVQELTKAAIAEGIFTRDTAPRPAARPWPVVLMTGLGAWLAAVPLLGVLFMLFGSALEQGVLCYVLGAVFLYGAVRVLRSHTVSPFVEQLGLPVLLVGGALLVSGLFRDMPYIAAETLLLGLIFGTAWLVPQHWLRVLLGTLAGLTFILMNTNLHDPGHLHLWAGNQLALVVWLIAAFFADSHAPSRQSARRMIVLETMSNGWILLTLAALAYDAGATFLSPAALGPTLGATANFADDSTYLLVKAVSAMMAIAGAGWLAQRWPALRATRYAAAAAILAILSWLVPGLGAALLALAACVGSGRWRLAVASAVAAGWIIGTFYYQLDVTLATKAAIMIAMGTALGGIAWLGRDANDQPAIMPSAPPTALATRPMQQAGIIASLALTLVVANFAIWQKETLIGTGRPVFIALAPVDPRSLMQGDYMALNFQLPPLATLRTARRAQVVATIDHRGVAVIQRLVTNQPLAADEIVIELVQTDSGLRPASNAWYFKEGEAQRWSAAKYGEFRIDGNGRALLVNLRGPNLENL